MTAAVIRCSRGRRENSRQASRIHAQSAARATSAPTTPYGHQVNSEATTPARPAASSAGCHEGGEVEELARLAVAAL